MQTLEDLILADHPLWLMLWATGYFLTIYGVLAGAASGLAAWFGRPIERRARRAGQIADEIRYSLRSILIFGGGMAVPWGMFHVGLANISFASSPLRLGGDLVLLVLWNELHFYAMHRLLHQRFPKAHVLHHRSLTSSAFASYSMSVTEAVLLGSVMPMAMPFHDFSALALLLLPVWSLLINSLAHSNCNLFPKARDGSLLAFVRHHQCHHSYYHGNYAFLFPVVDRWFATGSSSQKGHA